MNFSCGDPYGVNDQLSHDESVGKYVMMNRVKIFTITPGCMFGRGSIVCSKRVYLTAAPAITMFAVDYSVFLLSDKSLAASR